MTTMTYTTLQADIQSYLERGDSLATDPDVYAQIPRLITLGEQRIATELKLDGFKRVVTFPFTAGESVYPKPERWKKTVSMTYALVSDGETRVPINPRAYNYLRVFWPDATAGAAPEYYADYDYNHWVFAPTPNEAYNVELIYYELPPLLSDAVQTNWITDHAPQLLLYATLLEATPYLKDDSRLDVWQAFYDRAAGMFNGESLSRIFDASVKREGS